MLYYFLVCITSRAVYERIEKNFERKSIMFQFYTLCSHVQVTFGQYSVENDWYLSILSTEWPFVTSNRFHHSLPNVQTKRKCIKQWHENRRSYQTNFVWTQYWYACVMKHDNIRNKNQYVLNVTPVSTNATNATSSISVRYYFH